MPVPCIYSYAKRVSAVKHMSKTLGISQYIYPEHPPHNTFIINWGCSHINFIDGLNQGDAVHRAVNKITCLTELLAAGISTVPFTADRRIAQDWLTEGFTVFCRNRISSFGGKGISVVHPGEPLQDAKFWTQCIQVKREYRVHAFVYTETEDVIDLTAKRLKRGLEESLVKNHHNGYIYVRNSVKIPDNIRDELKQLSITTLKTLGLNFGAVDIIRGTDDKLYVLEVNTAPGIMGESLERYTAKFKSIVDSLS